MEAPDWTAIGAGVGSGIGAVLVKIGWDAKRGGNGSALKEKVDAHIKDDEDKFGKLFDKLDKVAENVAFIRGQLSKD